MSNFYQTGGRSAAQTLINKPIGVLRATAATRRIVLWEVGCFTTTATSSSVGLCRSSTAGTNTATIAGQPHDSGDPVAIGTVDATYSADPTMATSTPLSRGFIPATIGAGFVWTWWGTAGLAVPATTANGIALFSIAAPSASTTWDVYFLWSE